MASLHVRVCEPLKGHDCQRSICKVFPVMLEMDKTITQMIEKTFFRVYSSMCMKISPQKLKLNRCCNKRGVSGYGCVNELLQIWEGCRFTSYHEVVSTKCLPACTCLVVNSR